MGLSGRFRFIRYLLMGVGLLFAANRGDAQRFEYIITFDKVAVEGVDSTAETPALAHLDVPIALEGEQSGTEKPATSAERKPDQAKKSERPDDLLPKPIKRPSRPAMSFPPGQGTSNPSFVQEGFLVEAFWAVNTGTPEAYFKRAHFHPPDLSSGFEAQHLGNPNELHGIFIRSLDGKRFGLRSLQYRVTRNRQIPNKALSIRGFSNYSINVLVGRSFDPRASIRTYFVAFPVGLPMGNDVTLPWWTLPIFGFEKVEQVYIASSASVDFDNIILTRSEPPPALVPHEEEDK